MLFPSRPDGPIRNRLVTALILLAAIPALTLFLAMGAGCGDDDDEGNGGPVDPGGGTASVSGVVTFAYSFFGAGGVAVSLEPFATSSKMPSKAPTAVTVTDEQGSFTLSKLDAGTYWLNIDGRSAGPGTSEPFPAEHYARHRQKVEVGADQSVMLENAIYLHSYNDEFFSEYDGSEALTLAGGSLEVILPEGTVTYPDVLTPERVGIAGIPTDRTPVPLPTGLAPTWIAAVEPMGTTFDPGAMVRVLNDFGAEEGATLDIVGLDHATSTFATLGTATLQENGWFEADAILETATIITRACPEHTVVGKVVNQQLQGVPGVEIQLVQPGNNVSGEFQIPGMTATTDADGEFAMSGVRTCFYSLRGAFLSDAGTTLFSLDELTPGVNDTTDVGEIELSEVEAFVRFDVEGTVRTVDGTPMAGMSVYWDFSVPGASSGFGSFTELITGQRASGAAVPSFPPAMTGPDGTYRIHLESGANQPMRFIALSEPAYYGAEVDTTSPGLTDNGTTMTIDLTVCPASGACAAGNWSLDGDALNVTSDTDACRPEDQSTDITVIALTDGVLTMEVTEGEDTAIWKLERVQGSGPTGVSAANLAGLYRVTVKTQSPTAKADSWEYVGLRPDARIVSDQGYDVQSGTFTVDGQRLILEPTFVDGRHGPLVYDVSVLGDRLILVNLAGDVVWNLIRCEGAGDTLDGVWTLDGRGRDGVPTFIFQGSEYSIALNGYLGGIVGPLDD